MGTSQKNFNNAVVVAVTEAIKTATARAVPRLIRKPLAGISVVVESLRDAAREIETVKNQLGVVVDFIIDPNIGVKASVENLVVFVAGLQGTLDRFSSQINLLAGEVRAIENVRQLASLNIDSGPKEMAEAVLLLKRQIDRLEAKLAQPTASVEDEPAGTEDVGFKPGISGDGDMSDSGQSCAPGRRTDLGHRP
ncbi:MAG: hypothetical protein AAB408_00305 [Patescibacteria group bacterium]